MQASIAGAYFFGSNTPFCLKTSATMGTVELTGLEMTRTNALGAVVAMPVARSRTMPALICVVSDMVTESDEYIALALKRSSLQRAERQGQYGTTRAIRMHFAPRHLQRSVNI